MLSVSPDDARAHMHPGEGTDLRSISTSAHGATARPVIESDVVPVIRSHIASTTEWRPEEIEIRSIRNLNGFERPAGEATFRVSRNTAPADYRRILLPIEVCVDHRFHRMIWVSADIRIKATVVQAARRLRYGSAIAEGDVRAARVEIRDARRAYLRDTRDAVGMVLRRAVMEGEPLTRDALSVPLLVRSGETVRLRLQRVAVCLTTSARAEQSGKLGQFIRVRNIDFARTLRAQVVGRGEVVIK
jgi:flagella basal body P-ring formation protein FlgA